MFQGHNVCTRLYQRNETGRNKILNSSCRLRLKSCQGGRGAHIYVDAAEWAGHLSKKNVVVILCVLFLDVHVFFVDSSYFNHMLCILFTRRISHASKIVASLCLCCLTFIVWLLLQLCCVYSCCVAVTAEQLAPGPFGPCRSLLAAARPAFDF